MSEVETTREVIEATRTAFPVGTRVRLKNDVERYPHFVAKKGALGTVVVQEGDDPGYFRVRMDDDLGPGGKEWRNEVHWYIPNDDDPREEVEKEETMKKPRTYLSVRFDVTELSEEERSGLEGEVVVQAESSERHPDVPVVEVAQVQAYELPVAEVVEGPPVCDPDDPAFQEKLEQEWWNREQGELNLDDDPALRALLRDLRAYMTPQVWDGQGRLTQDQLDGEGNFVAQLTEEEVARRFVAALAVVLYGGA